MAQVTSVEQAQPPVILDAPVLEKEETSVKLEAELPIVVSNQSVLPVVVLAEAEQVEPELEVLNAPVLLAVIKSPIDIPLVQVVDGGKAGCAPASICRYRARSRVSA